MRDADKTLVDLIGAYPELPILIVTPNELMQKEAAVVERAYLGEVIEYFGKVYTDAAEFHREYYCLNGAWLNYTYKYSPWIKLDADEVAREKNTQAKIKVDRYIDKVAEENTIYGIIVETKAYKRDEEDEE